MIERFSSASPYEDVFGYSRVVRAGGWYVTAGCTATVDGSLLGVGDAYLQAVTALKIGIAALEQAGCPRDQIVRSALYVTSRDDAEAVGRAHVEVLGDVRPTTSLLVVAGLLSPEMLVEIELTGFVDPEPLP